MSELLVRAYNVGCGEALLVSIPERTGRDRERVRHLLVDVGNTPGDTASDDVLLSVVADIAERTGGEVDLYVMTHEHLEQVRGLRSASRRGLALGAKYAWLTGTSAQRRPELGLALADVVRSRHADGDPRLEWLVENNSPLLPPDAGDLSAADCVDHLRTLAPDRRTSYVDRSTRLGRRHPFREAVLRVLAPDPDPTAYYRRVVAGTLTTASGPEEGGVDTRRRQVPAQLGAPPVGVDPGAFFDLLRARRDRTRTRLMDIDAATDDTSLVIEVEWRGWRLLLPGDAGHGSWQRMRDSDALRPAHVVKVPQHGGAAGGYTQVLEQALPVVSPDGRERHALVSTGGDGCGGAPDRATLDFYEARCTLHDTRTVAPGASVEVALSG
jgi:hypothetical protein